MQENPELFVKVCRHNLEYEFKRNNSKMVSFFKLASRCKARFFEHGNKCFSITEQTTQPGSTSSAAANMCDHLEEGSSFYSQGDNFCSSTFRSKVKVISY